jgi:hypothetical protein
MRNQDRINLSKKIITDGAYTYICSAPPGADEATAVWQIKRVDSSNGAKIMWCDGDDNFDNIATDPTGLNYV